MTPRIHNKGTSFKGIANYLLHDKGTTETSERVAWTKTRNMATDNPHAAWRVMAATSMNQSQIKKQAGMKATGRKSKDHVLHYSLSWTADEKEDLTREEMERAAIQSLKYIGASKSESTKKVKILRDQYANEHQVLIVAHLDDTDQPHVHVVVNRVHPEHGIILPSKKEKDKIQDWALEYDRSRDMEHLCPNRAINRKSRTREWKHTPYRKHMAEKKARSSNDNDKQFEAIKKDQAAKDRQLILGTQALKTTHAKQWDELQSRYQRRKERIESAAEKVSGQKRYQARKDTRRKWEENFHETQAETRDHERTESRFRSWVSGKFQAFRSYLFKDNIRGAASENFNAEASSGLLKKQMQHQQEDRDRQLADRQKQAELAAAGNVRQRQKALLDKHSKAYLDKRSTLIETHKQEKAYQKQKWQVRNNERQKVLSDFAKLGKDLNKTAEKSIDKAKAQPKDKAPVIDRTALSAPDKKADKPVMTEAEKKTQAINDFKENFNRTGRRSFRRSRNRDDKGGRER